MINTAHLSVESAPPLQIPFRFMLTAPLFGGLFALLLILHGEGLVVNRWNPLWIGALHLINIGLLLMLVSGVLFQMLPVVGGVQFPKVRSIALLLHAGLTLGPLMFAGGFFFSQPLLLQWAVWVLMIGLLPYVLLFMVAIFRPERPPDLVRLIRYALPFLLFLVLLGGMLLMGWSSEAVALKREWTDLHAVWGLGGWFTLLLMATSFQLVPMFQVTPEFPHWLKQWMVPFVAVMLMLWGFSIFLKIEIGRSLLLAMAAAGVALYGATTLYLLSRRKRKIFDTTVLFWQIALSMLTAGGGWLAVTQLIGTELPAWLGVLWIFGVLLPMLSGMLLKIAPFLVFLHLQQQMIRDPEQMGNLASLPNLFQILPTRWGRILLGLYLLNVVVLLLSLYWPVLFSLLGVVLLSFFSWLGWIVYRCYHVYNMRAL